MSSDQVEEPPEFAVEAGENFLDDDIPNAPSMSDFCQDLEFLNIEVTRAKSPEVGDNTCSAPEETVNAPSTKDISSDPAPLHQAKETVTSPSNYEGVEEEANAPPMFESAPPVFESAPPMFESGPPVFEHAPPIYLEDVASAPQFEVEASAPVFEEELAQEAVEEELEDLEAEAAYAAIQPFTESQV